MVRWILIKKKRHLLRVRDSDIFYISARLIDAVFLLSEILIKDNIQNRKDIELNNLSQIK